jgi:hypothetical protein
VLLDWPVSEGVRVQEGVVFLATSMTKVRVHTPSTKLRVQGVSSETKVRIVLTGDGMAVTSHVVTGGDEEANLGFRVLWGTGVQGARRRRGLRVRGASVCGRFAGAIFQGGIEGGLGR